MWIPRQTHGDRTQGCYRWCVKCYNWEEITTADVNKSFNINDINDSLVSYLHCCRNNSLYSTPKDIVWVNLTTTASRKIWNHLIPFKWSAIQYHPSVTISVSKSFILPYVCVLNVVIGRVKNMKYWLADRTSHGI